MTKPIEIPFKVSMQGNAQSVFSQIQNGFKKIALGLQKAAKAQLELQNVDLASALGHTSLAINKMATSITQGSTGTKAFTSGIKALNQEFLDVIKSSGTFGEKAKKIFQAVADGRMPIENATKHLKKLQLQFQGFKVVGKETTLLKDRFARLSAGIKVGTLEFEKAKKDTTDLGTALGSIANKMKLAGIADRDWLKSIKESSLAQAERKGHLELVGNKLKIVTEEGYKALGLSTKQTAALKIQTIGMTQYHKELAYGAEIYKQDKTCSHTFLFLIFFEFAILPISTYSSQGKFSFNPIL
jgi:hypothetical protein